MIPFRPIIDQDEWGHPTPYPDGTWVPYTPDRWVIHWGGVGPYRITTKALAKRLALGWRGFHVNSRGWRDIAYNFMAWWSPLRLRGLNQNGAHVNSAKWGRITCTVVFPTGVHDPTPHRKMLRGFARMWLEHPMPVTGHGLLPDQNTSCPGPWLRQWITDEGWVDELAGMRFGQASANVRSLRRRLHDLGYFKKRGGRVYGTGVRRAVADFKANHPGLGADPNRVNAAMIRQLGDTR